jgi:prepilin-type processing-associated H-X9-DG protein
MNEMLGTGFLQFSSAANLTELQMSAPKLTEVRNPSEKLMLMEEDPGTIDDGNAQPIFYGNSYPCFLSITHSNVKKYEVWNNTSGTVPNPSDSGNVCFCDGSVRYVTRAQAHTVNCFAPRF